MDITTGRIGRSVITNCQYGRFDDLVQPSSIFSISKAWMTCRCETELLSSFRAKCLCQMSDKSSAARLAGAPDSASGRAFGVQTTCRHFDNSLPVFDPVTCTKRTPDKWSLIGYVKLRSTIFLLPYHSNQAFLFLCVFVYVLFPKKMACVPYCPLPFLLLLRQIETSNIKARLG